VSLPRIALVQDALPFFGGAERTLSAVLEVFPSAPIYTLVYNPAPFRGTPIEKASVQTGFINRLPRAHHNHRVYLPLMQYEIERLNLDDFDIVLSFSYAVAHGVRSRPGQLHISYTCTPMRYAWQAQEQFLKRIPPGALRVAARIYLYQFRRWDVRASQRVHHYIAISRWIASLIKDAYKRRASVLYPPVNIDKLRPLTPRGNYFLVVSRLVAHKRIDLIVKAFNQLKLPLWIAGSGPEERRLRALAGPTVRLLGWQSESNLPELYGRARAFIHACEEDFGIALVEAQASGCPVIAFQHGSAAELVIDGETGMFYSQQSTGGIIDAIQQFETGHTWVDPTHIQRHAAYFSRTRFQQELSALINTDWESYQQGKPLEYSDGRPG
jgi:glycosyltransferase involved in cell wall biosynthesis